MLGPRGVADKPPGMMVPHAALSGDAYHDARGVHCMPRDSFRNVLLSVNAKMLSCTKMKGDKSTPTGVSAGAKETGATRFHMLHKLLYRVDTSSQS